MFLSFEQAFACFQDSSYYSNRRALIQIRGDQRLNNFLNNDEQQFWTGKRSVGTSQTCESRRVPLAGEEVTCITCRINTIPPLKLTLKLWIQDNGSHPSQSLTRGYLFEAVFESKRGLLLFLLPVFWTLWLRTLRFVTSHEKMSPKFAINSQMYPNNLGKGGPRKFRPKIRPKSCRTVEQSNRTGKNSGVV